MLSKFKLYFIYYLLSFPIVYGIYALNYKNLNLPNIPIVQIVLAIISIIFIRIFGKNWILFNKIKNVRVVFYLTFGLLVLFFINNYFIIIYDEIVTWRVKYKEIAISSILLHYILSSTSEEIIYRGFIQNYINNNLVKKEDTLITKGNWIATSIMAFIHLGFFAYFNLFFAITSFILVILFSLISGYIMDKTKNIFIPITIHILVNFIHYFTCIGVMNNYF